MKSLLIALAVAALAATGAGAHTAQLSVTITSGPEGTVAATTAEFAFTANVRTADFFCSLDGAPPTPCSSPMTYRGLGEGRHVFEVTARDGRELARASREWTVGGDTPPPTDPPSPDPKKPPVGDTPPPAATCGFPGLIEICFDDLRPGQELRSQLAGKGVQVGFTPNDQLGNTGVFPFIAAHDGAFSDGQLIQTPLCPGSEDFCFNTIHFRFSNGHRYVRVRAGGGTDVVLEAFDANGTSLGKVSKATGDAAATIIAFTLPPDAPNPIAYFTVGEDQVGGQQRAQLLLDDLAFDPPDPNEKPDFGLSWVAPWADNTLGVAKGGPAATTTIHLTRFGGSSGQIAFSATGPPGISATFTPVNANTATTTVIVKVSAAANAADLQPPAALTVKGHPLVASAGVADRAVKIPLLVLLSNYDVQVSGVEVTQGIQKQTASYYSGSGPSSSLCSSVPSLGWTNETPRPPLSYSDPSVGYVKLVAGRKTVVRVFASLKVPAGGSTSDVPAKLYGKQGGQPLPGSPLSPYEGARDLVSSQVPWTTCADRADPLGAYTFTLPDSWTSGGGIDLDAVVFPQTEMIGPGAECGSAACLDNNHLKLKDISFTSMPAVTVTPLALTYNQPGGSYPGSPKDVFAQTRFFSPAPLVWSGASDYGYAAWMDISWLVPTQGDGAPAKCSWLLDIVMAWALNDPVAELAGYSTGHPHGNMTVGVFSSSADVCAGVTDGGYQLFPSKQSFHVVAASRPLTSVAHEVFHGFGRKHADTGCGGNSNGQVGENWPPDLRGEIHGIGLDTRTFSGSPTALYRPIVPGSALVAGSALAAGQAAQWVDFMSYCADNTPPESDSWISDRGWDSTVVLLKAFQQIAPSRQSGTVGTPGPPGLSVSALASSSGAQIVRVEPIEATASVRVESPFRVVGRDGAGQLTADAPMTVTEPHVHGGGAPLVLFGSLAAPGATSVEVVRDGVVLARRMRSVARPEVEITRPRGGERVGAGRTVVVEWRASDPDGDALTVSIDASLDGGRTWRTIYTGATRDRVALPSTLFARTANGRLRVRVSDGFDTAAAVSGRFTAAGRTPSVTIADPVRRQRVPSDTVLYLSGSAYDDRGSAIPGKRLSWFEGKRLLGRGARVGASGLAPGNRTIRLVARDRQGRVGSATVRVVIVASAPHFIELKAPSRLSRSATRVTLRVATNVPAVLEAAGRRVDTDRSPRAVTLRVPAGRGLLRVPLRLAAYGRTTRTTLVVRRS